MVIIYVLREGSLILEGAPKDVFKEEELLKSSHLEIPLALSIYNEISKDKNVDKKVGGCSMGIQFKGVTYKYFSFY